MVPDQGGPKGFTSRTGSTPVAARIRWGTRNTWEAERKVEQLLSMGVVGARVVYPTGGDQYTYVEAPTTSIVSAFSKQYGLF